MLKILNSDGWEKYLQDFSSINIKGLTFTELL